MLPPGAKSAPPSGSQTSSTYKVKNPRIYTLLSRLRRPLMFTAVVTIVVAIVGAVIAWGQFSLARMRMQHDLYDRRYKMFESTRRLIAEIVREGRSTNQHVLTYLRETGDAVFLLDRSTVAYMNELEQQARRLAF